MGASWSWELRLRPNLPDIPSSVRGVGWRPRLSLRHKSISLDSPEVGPAPIQGGVSSSPTYSSTGRLPSYGVSQSPSSPIHQSRIGSGGLPAPSLRGSRGELERNSPHSGSPGQSPKMKGTRQLPSNIYAVLYNFQPRREDELGLSAGSTVHVLDISDSDWWRGRCTITGSTGFLPSTYLARTLPAERVFRVTHPCNLISKTGEMFSLIRDQIVLGLPPLEGEQEIIVRTGESGQPVRGRVPLRYLTSV